MLQCCQPHPNDPQQQIYANNPCQHETPSVIIAKLPHSCKAELGNTEACYAEDPASKEFVREVDTAERLDLATIRIPSVEVDTALPERIDGNFTAGQIALKASVTQRNPPAFSADALPFVPRSFSTAPIRSPASTPGDMMALDEDLDDAVENTLIDSTKEDIVNLQQDGEGQPDEKSDNLQSDDVKGEETVHEEVTQPSDTESESSDEFFDIEMPPTLEYVISESSTAREENTVIKPEEPELELELESSAENEGSYDDMITLWALDDDDQAADQTTKPSSWGISSLLCW